MLTQYQITGDAFSVELNKLTHIAIDLIPEIEKELDKLNAPMTPGRLPIWVK